jgi:mRNA interferase MazF
MHRGEVWWAKFDEPRPVVLLSDDEPSGFRAMQVVAPADTDISSLGAEVAVGIQEGLPFEGVLRVAFPRPGFTPCTWLTTLSRDDLIEQAGALSPAKLIEIDDALRASERRLARGGRRRRSRGVRSRETGNLNAGICDVVRAGPRTQFFRLLSAGPCNRLVYRCLSSL